MFFKYVICSVVLSGVVFASGAQLAPVRGGRTITLQPYPYPLEIIVARPSSGMMHKNPLTITETTPRPTIVTIPQQPSNTLDPNWVPTFADMRAESEQHALEVAAVMAEIRANRQSDIGVIPTTREMLISSGLFFDGLRNTAAASLGIAAVCNQNFNNDIKALVVFEIVFNAAAFIFKMSGVSMGYKTDSAFAHICSSYTCDALACCFIISALVLQGNVSPMTPLTISTILTVPGILLPIGYGLYQTFSSLSCARR